MANYPTFNVTSFLAPPAPTEKPLKGIFSIDILYRKVALLYALLVEEKKDKEIYKKAALAHIELGFTQLAETRGHCESEKDRLKLGKQATLLAELGIKICLSFNSDRSQNINKQAFIYSEAAKAGSLRLILQEAAAKKIAGILDSLLALEQTIKAAIIHCQNALLELGNAQSSSVSLRKTTLQSLSFRYNQELTALQALFAEKYPVYHCLKYANRACDVEP